MKQESILHDSIERVRQNTIAIRQEYQSNTLFGDEQIKHIAAAKEVVKSRLKSPTTAEFSDVKASKSNGVITVSGKVDSQNSFGAMIRNNFIVQFENGKVIDINFY